MVEEEGREEKVALRKPYKQFMKVIAASLIDANGALKARRAADDGKAAGLFHGRTQHGRET